PEGNQIFNVVSWDISKQMFESEQIKLLSLVAQKTTNTVIITDRNGDIKWVNDGFYRLTGYTLNEVQGKNPGKLLQGINTNPDDIDKLKNAIEAEEPLQVEILNYRKDGLSYWVEIFLDPIFDQFGRLQEFIAIQRDITERKRRQKNLQDSNQSLRRALDELKYQKFALDEHSIVSTTDAQGIITYANSKFCEISKYPLSEIIGKNHRIINSGYHDSAFFKEMYRTIYNGKTWNGEIKNRAKDGSYYWVDTTIVPYRDKVGNRAKGFISIRTDITDKMENLSHLKNKNKNLEEIAWAQSHELRAPLANILGLVNLLKDNTFDDKKTKELVHHLSVSSNEMDVVIGKIVRLCEKVDEM
ncbi:MAG: PAS domain-containing protein, partial [Bacteroidia bacterium]